MTCPTLALRRTSLLPGETPDPAREVARAARSLHRWMTSEGTVAQLTRFGGVGLVSSAAYACVFLAGAAGGDLLANLLGVLVSTALANELHRRLTFHAGDQVSWQAAQYRGGSLAVVGVVATSLGLVVLDQVAPSAPSLVQIAMVAAITTAMGLARFFALRVWVFPSARRS